MILVYQVPPTFPGTKDSPCQGFEIVLFSIFPDWLEISSSISSRVSSGIFVQEKNPTFKAAEIDSLLESIK